MEKENNPIIKQSKNKNREKFSPTSKTGKYNQASIHQHSKLQPSAGKLNPPGDWKKGVLVNTHTIIWEYTRTFKGKAKKRDVTRPVVSAIKEDDFYLNKK
jgi:hypothetical protein